MYLFVCPVTMLPLEATSKIASIKTVFFFYKGRQYILTDL